MAVLVALLTTCKKYPEGGFEFLAKHHLLKHNGTWLLTDYEVNGIDSTELINYNGNENYKIVSFSKEATRHNAHIYGKSYPTFTYIVTFAATNEILQFRSGSPDSPQPAYVCGTGSTYSGCFRTYLLPEGIETNWKVIKLNKSELILTCSQKNSYKLKFKRR